MASKACEFVGILFLARDLAHSVHLSTRSYSKHRALQEFYEDIVPLVDKFAEAYQGRHGMIGPIDLVSEQNPGKIEAFLQSSMTQIEKMRYEVCEKTDTALQNIIDEIVGLYLATLYKLRFLA